MKKFLSTLLVSMVLTTPVFASVNQTNNEVENLYGIEAQNDGFVNFNNGSTLYQENGKLTREQFKTIDGKVYYFDNSGLAMKQGWRYINNTWYFFDINGTLVNQK